MVKNRKKQGIVSLMLVSMVLSACSGMGNHRYQSINHKARPHVERVAFDPDEIKHADQVAHLVGRAYLREQNQERVGSDLKVVLNPVSTASTQWYQEVCRQGKVLVGNIDPLYEHAMVVTKTNPYGQFAFPNIPVGEYYLSTRLYWMDETPFSGPIEYGGLLAKKVMLTEGAMAIDLNQKDACLAYFRKTSR